MTDGAGPDRRVVVITGASSGIGRVLAQQLAARGDRLVLSSRAAQPLDDTLAECVRAGASVEDVTAHVADVKDGAAVDRLIDECARRYGRVDAVVHSAGSMAYGRFDALPAEVFDGTVSTVLGGTSHVARSALRRFKAQGGGHLVVIGSVLGSMAAPDMSAYVTAKWGVHGLVRCLQIEARDTPGVEVSLVAPGGVDTPIYRQAGTYTGRRGWAPPPVDSPDTVARAVVAVLERPRRHTSVGAFNQLLVLGFVLAPGLFDRLVTPLFTRLAQSPTVGVAPTPGNVLQAVPEGEATRGGYRRWGSLANRRG